MKAPSGRLKKKAPRLHFRYPTQAIVAAGWPSPTSKSGKASAARPENFLDSRRHLPRCTSFYPRCLRPLPTSREAPATHWRPGPASPHPLPLGGDTAGRKNLTTLRRVEARLSPQASVPGRENITHLFHLSWKCHSGGLGGREALPLTLPLLGDKLCTTTCVHLTAHLPIHTTSPLGMHLGSHVSCKWALWPLEGILRFSLMGDRGKSTADGDSLTPPFSLPPAWKAYSHHTCRLPAWGWSLPGKISTSGRCPHRYLTSILR